MKQNKMQIPEGYKNSSLGIIPNDWEVKRLGEVCSKIGDGIHGTPEYSISTDYFFINGNNLVKGKIRISQETKCVSEKEYRSQNIELNANTILISINGTIGNIAIYNGERIMLGKSAAYLIFKDNLYYYYQLLNSEFIKNYWKSELSGTTIKNLSLKSIRETPFSLPPLPQQQKIAEILGTWDEAIEKQSKLIDRLTDRKRGLMQQLLTGKKRLAGFSEEWKEVRLGEISLFFSGGTPKSSESRFYNGTIPFIKSGEISRDTTEQKISLEGLANSSAKMIDIGDILYALYGATSGECAISKMKGAINQAVLCIRTESNKKFILSVLQMNKSLYIENFLQGGQGNLSADIVKSYIIKLPSLPEQTAIANILTAADKEIELAKSKLELLRSQKSGLMQELLTGKTRVKID